jgi:predicted Zn-dependent protease
MKFKLYFALLVATLLVVTLGITPERVANATRVEIGHGGAIVNLKYDVEKIYKKVKAEMPEQFQDITLIIAEGSEINATAAFYAREITVYVGLIDYAESEDEIASIIGHEFGHFVIWHSGLSYFISDKREELISDKIGSYYANKAGYNMCLASKIWERMERDFPTGPYGSASHPDRESRIYAVKIYCGDYDE